MSMRMMTKTERKAYQWLLKQGVPKDAIVYQHRQSPDFVFTDRQDKYEVKRLYGKKILLRALQHEALLVTHGKVNYLVFSDKLDNPVAMIPVTDIKVGDERCKGVLLHWVKLDTEKLTISVTLKEEQMKWLDKQVKQGTFPSRDHGIQVAIEMLRKR